jgi:ribosomal protein S18 acetylase RimI-like enzyme
MPMNTHELAFHTIDLDRHADNAVAFRRDAHVCSFGHDAGFGDAAEYVAWLRDRITRHPDGHVHLWRGGAIVGQIEMVTAEVLPVRGYVNLFYLVPEVRGQGVGDELHRYFVQFMRARGAHSARLSVSPSNQRALAYYAKHRWHDIGVRLDNGSVHLLELDLQVAGGHGPSRTDAG